jgi:hypothetical protein
MSSDPLLDAASRRAQFISEMEKQESAFNPEQHTESGQLIVFPNLAEAHEYSRARVFAKYREDLAALPGAKVFNSAFVNQAALPDSAPPYAPPAAGHPFTIPAGLSRSFVFAPPETPLVERLRAAAAEQPEDIVDVSTPAGQRLILGFTELFLDGATLPVARLLKQLDDQIQEDIRGGENLSSLKVVVFGAKSRRNEAAESVASFPLGLRWIWDVLREGQLPAMFDYLGEAGTFKQVYWFADAAIQSTAACASAAEVAEGVQAKELRGTLNLSTLPKYSTFVPEPAQFVWRVHAAVAGFLSANHRFLVEQVPFDVVGSAGAIARLIALTLLQTKKGEIASWELIPKMVKRIDPSIVEAAGGRAVGVVGTIIVQGKAADIVKRLSAAGSAVSDPAYWGAAEEIAKAFAPLGDAAAGLDLADFERTFAELETFIQ